jgi:hypothetical protein
MIFDFILYFLLFFGFLMWLEVLFNLIVEYWRYYNGK